MKNNLNKNLIKDINASDFLIIKKDGYISKLFIRQNFSLIYIEYLIKMEIGLLKIRSKPIEIKIIESEKNKETIVRKYEDSL